MSDLLLSEAQLDRSSIGSCIRRLRMKNGMKQVDLASHLSVTSSTISNWENGRRLPSIEELRKVAVLFDVSLAVFSTLSDEQVKEQQEPVPSLQTPQVSITLRTYDLVMSFWDSLLPVIAFLALLLCVFFDGTIRYSMYCFGLLSLFISIMTMIIQSARNRHTKTRTINVAYGGTIQYVHTSDELSITCMRKTSSLLFSMTIVTTALLFTLLYILVLPLQHTLVTLCVIILGAISVLVNYVRKNDAHLNLVMSKRIREDSVRSGLDQIVYHLPLLIETVIVIFGSTVIVFTSNAFFMNPLLVSIAMSLFMFNLFVSYWFFITYRKHLNGFKLYLAQDDMHFIPLS